MPVITTNKCLNNKDFLNDITVKRFLQFLTGYVSNRFAFEHEYRDRKSGKDWKCDSVFDAYKKYSYPLKKKFRAASGSDFLGFDANAVALKGLQSKLRECYINCDQTSETYLRDISKDIFDWGGVLRSNGCWLDGYADSGASIRSLYDKAKKIFTASEPDLDGILKTGVRSNAGFTKVYSLLFDDFIIYDSRVAAALGLFVIKFCKDNTLEVVPSILDFNWMPPKEGPKSQYKKLRDASTGRLKFSGVNSDEKKHANSNIRANWLLSELLSHKDYLGTTPLGTVTDKQDKMRALESAFFMIGYDLRGHPWLTDTPMRAG